MISHIYFDIWLLINKFQDHFIDPKMIRVSVQCITHGNKYVLQQLTHIFSNIHAHHMYITIKHSIDIKVLSHKSINVNRLNSMNKDVNVKISSSQVHAEFLKIVLRQEVW